MSRDSIPDKIALRKCIQTSMETVTIGSIAVFEELFGYMWGHGKHVSELTTEEKECREIWSEVRDRIFDRSHNSRKIVLNTLDRFSVRKKRFFEEF